MKKPGECRVEGRLWRRGADSNRRIEVLQTSPLASWVPRLNGIIGQLAEAVNLNSRQKLHRQDTKAAMARPPSTAVQVHCPESSAWRNMLRDPREVRLIARVAEPVLPDDGIPLHEE
jgi:hypothetical protein